MGTHWTLILIAALANVALNLCLKKAGQGLDTSSIGTIAIGVLRSGWMWLAGISAVILLSAFVAAIRTYSLSLTYTAVTAIAMVTLTAIGAALQTEQINLLRIAGLTLIVLGLVVSAIASAALD